MGRVFLRTATAVVCGVLLSNTALANGTAEPNVVIRWNQAVLQAVRDTRMAPPQTARALAIVHTSMYGAWDCKRTYDSIVNWLPAASFRLPASSFQLPASGFRLPAYPSAEARS